MAQNRLENYYSILIFAKKCAYATQVKLDNAVKDSIIIIRKLSAPWVRDKKMCENKLKQKPRRGTRLNKKRKTAFKYRIKSCGNIIT